MPWRTARASAADSARINIRERIHIKEDYELQN
jgi:hypothetical protein